MKLNHLLVAVLAGTGLQQVAVAQVGYQTSMCVTTQIGTCGDFCQFFNCQPNYTLVSSHEDMVFDIAGAPGSHYVLFYGVAVPGCLTVPTIAGQLATWVPTAAITMGWLNVTDRRFDLECQPTTTTFVQHIPAVPPGVDLRFQLLGLNEIGTTNGEMMELSFSRPTEVRTR